LQSAGDPSGAQQKPLAKPSRDVASSNVATEIFASTFNN
jgi:hypothetical protein